MKTSLTPKRSRVERGLLVTVPDAESINPVQLGYTLHTPFQVGEGEDLGIRMTLRTITLLSIESLSKSSVLYRLTVYVMLKCLLPNERVIG
jgi:hypothetical protein